MFSSKRPAPIETSSVQSMLFVVALILLSWAVNSQRATMSFGSLVPLAFSLVVFMGAFSLFKTVANENRARDTESGRKISHNTLHGEDRVLDSSNNSSLREQALAWMLKATIVLQLAFFVDWYQSLWLFAVVIGVAVLLDAPWFGFVKRSETARVFATWLRWRGTLILVLYGLLCVSLLNSIIGVYTRIDVYHFQQDGARALLQGVNPYTLRPPSTYPPDAPFYAPELVKNGVLQFGYPYMPLTLLMAVPGYLLGDVRFSLLAATLLSGWLILQTGRVMEQKAPVSVQVSILAASSLLLFPHFLWVLRNSWSDGFVVVLFCVVIWCAARRSPWLPVAIGLWIVSKQYVVLLLPLIGLLFPLQTMWTKKRFYTIVYSMALIVSLPMILWNVREFLWSAVLLQFHQPLRDDSLSLLVAFKLLAGVQPPTWIPFAALLLATAWAVKIAPRTVHGFCASCTLVFFVFIALNKQAFINYYFVVFAMMCCTLATSFARDSEQIRD